MMCSELQILYTRAQVSGITLRNCHLLLFKDKLFVHMSVYDENVLFNIPVMNIKVTLLHIYQSLTNTTNCAPVASGPQAEHSDTIRHVACAVQQHWDSIRKILFSLAQHFITD